jgi:hypothetical protein
MFKFEVGDLVEYKRYTSISSRHYPIDIPVGRAPVKHNINQDCYESSLMNSVGIIMKRYRSIRPGDWDPSGIPFDRLNTYIVYFQQEMKEYFCFEPEMERYE